MSLLARFRLEQTARHNRHKGSPSGLSRPPSLSPARSQDQGLYFPSSSPPHSPTSHGFPPAQARRRERSNSSDLEAEYVLKRKRLHALDTCRENQLEDDALDQFADLEVPQMLITLQGTLLVFERGRVKDEAQTFIQSPQFKEILKDRLRTCLLSPNLSKYLDGLPEHLWGFIKRNMAVFKIPVKALEDPEMSDRIDSLIKDILTKQWSQMKAKIALSINRQQHISQLAKSFSQKVFIDVTTSQWAWFAFLRQNMLLFNKFVAESLAKRMALPPSLEEEMEHERHDESDNFFDDEQDDNNQAARKEKPEKSRSWSDNQFWEFVDTLLDEMRSDLEKQPAALQKKEWEKNFTEALQQDLKIFPASDKASDLRVSDGTGISDWQRSLHQELVWL